MRVIALALAVFALVFVSGAAAKPGAGKLFVHSGGVSENVIDLSAPDFKLGINAPVEIDAPLGISGDGRLVSNGGRISALPGRMRANLPTKYLVWSPVGERAAWVTTSGSVLVWTPKGTKRIEPKGWGADWFFHENGLAWSADGSSLAIGRGAHVRVWRNGVTREVAGTAPLDPGTGGTSLAVPFAWSGDEVLWWSWPGSGSVAADGVLLFEGDRQLGVTLMYRDYTATCGSHVAFTEGGDRDSTDGKSMIFDGRPIGHDRLDSYTEPACTASGRLVAAVGRNNIPPLTTETHRSIWQLLPTRKQLTKPPWGWSDEDPHLFPNGDLVFVRTRSTFEKQNVTQTGHVMLLRKGKLKDLWTIGFTETQLSNTYPIEYYGHYDWTHQLAAWP